MSDDERYILDKKWKMSELNSRSAFLRNLIIYGPVYDVNYYHLKPYIRRLNFLGNKLNQIAKLCNATGKVYEKDVMEVREIMDQVWETHQDMLKNEPIDEQE